jgi:hypothetical protein
MNKLLTMLSNFISDFFFPTYPKIKSDEEAWKDDGEELKKDWESVVGKDDGKNPNWKRK